MTNILCCLINYLCRCLASDVTFTDVGGGGGEGDWRGGRGSWSRGCTIRDSRCHFSKTCSFLPIVETGPEENVVYETLNSTIDVNTTYCSYYIYTRYCVHVHVYVHNPYMMQNVIRKCL